MEKEEFVPPILTKKIINTEYVPLRGKEPKTSSRGDDSFVIETLNIHNPTVDKQKDTQFIVTMDGYDPNVFLTKKLLTEGLLEDDDKNKKPTPSVLKTKEKTLEKENVEQTESKVEAEERKEALPTEIKEVATESKNEVTVEEPPKHDKKKPKESHRSVTGSVQKKRLSDTSEESDTQVIINPETVELEQTVVKTETKIEVSPPVRKRKKSPIVFDVQKKEKKEKVRERTESVGSDNVVTITTTTNTHKYDAVPSLSTSAAVACRAFPLCRYGAACAFLHPRCRYGAACTRRACAYEHRAPAPAVASHVVAPASYKSIQPAAVPAVCKFYPGCVNPACHYSHPKPCRYGKACLNKAECNFYHPDSPATKWRYAV